MINTLSIYVEEWYHRNDIEVPYKIRRQVDGAVVEDTRKVLTILKRYNTKATFFVLGSIAERYPFLVKEIYDYGHEIASHGYEHKLVYKQTKEEFRVDLIKSIQILQEIIKEKILGYSAPSWSIIKDSYWAVDILQEQGLLYDSSIFPIRTFLYGIPNSPRFPYKIDHDNNLIEFPPSTIKFLGKNLPFSGGFFFRILPYRIIKECLRRFNKKGKCALVYMHPWELNHNHPKLELPVKKRVIPYVNLDGTEEKLHRLLNDFKFAPIRDIILTRSL